VSYNAFQQGGLALASSPRAGIRAGLWRGVLLAAVRALTHAAPFLAAISLLLVCGGCRAATPPALTSAPDSSNILVTTAPEFIADVAPVLTEAALAAALANAKATVAAARATLDAVPTPISTATLTPSPPATLTATPTSRSSPTITPAPLTRPSAGGRIAFSSTRDGGSLFNHERRRLGRETAGARRLGAALVTGRSPHRSALWAEQPRRLRHECGWFCTDQSDQRPGR